MAGGKFVITKGDTGQFRFSLVGGRGKTVVTSEAYATRASCMNGIKAVKTLAADADIEDQTKGRAGQPDMKAEAAARGATKTAAKAAKEAIAKAAPAKTAGKTAGKQAAGGARPRRTAG